MSQSAVLSSVSAVPAWPVQLRRTLSADALKLRRTAALWLALGSGALPVLLVFLIYFFKGEFLLKPGQNPWAAYVGLGWQTVAALLLPMFVVLLASLVLNVENRATGWKHLYAQPVSRLAVFGSKLLVLLGLNLVAQVVFLLLLLASGHLLGVLRPVLHFQDYAAPHWPVVKLLLHTYVATLGLLAVQYIAALWWRSFVPPVALGMACTVAALTLLRWEYIDWVPFAAPLLAMRSVGMAAGGMTVAGPLTTPELISLGWFGLVLAGGYALLQLRRERG